MYLSKVTINMKYNEDVLMQQVLLTFEGMYI